MKVSAETIPATRCCLKPCTYGASDVLAWSYVAICETDTTIARNTVVRTDQTRAVVGEGGAAGEGGPIGLGVHSLSYMASVVIPRISTMLVRSTSGFRRREGKRAAGTDLLLVLVMWPSATDPFRDRGRFHFMHRRSRMTTNPVGYMEVNTADAGGNVEAAATDALAWL